MNKWQRAYSVLKEQESKVKSGKFISEWVLLSIITVLIMLIEDKMNETS